MKTRTSGELVMTAERVEALEWVPFVGAPGVWTKALWRDPGGASYAGLMWIEPAAGVPRHRHRHAMHHIWIIDGSCQLADGGLGVGSYAFVPVGAEHEITRAGPEGCTLFYLYLVTAEID
jgi:quercetin dioxygenase-like cupin family protein